MLKVGEYARTNKGNIFIYANAVTSDGEKLDFIFKRVKSKEYIEGYDWERKHLFDEQIIEHSKDIIDLVKKGDYINGKKVVAIREGGWGRQLVVLGNNRIAITNSDSIKTIVTKERFSQMIYRVEAEK